MLTRAPAADLRPTPAFPGLWLAATPSPRGSFACACGHAEHAAGRDDVLVLVANHQEHDARCARTAPAATVPADQPTENDPQSASHIRAVQGKIDTDGIKRAA